MGESGGSEPERSDLPRRVAGDLRLEDLVTELRERTRATLLAADRSQLLLEAVLAVGTGLSLPDVLRSIVEGACRLAEARYGALGVIGADGRLSAFITVGIDDETRALIGDEPRGHGILGLLVQNPEPLMLGDLTQHVASVGFPPHHPRMRSFLGVPVRARNSVYGNLYLCEKEGADEFSETDQELIAALAVAAGVAIENASLYAEQRRREEWLAAIAAINRALLAGAPIHDVLHDIAVRAGAIARADAVRVMLGSDESRHLEIVATHGGRATETTGMTIPVEGTAAGEAYTTGEIQVVRDAADDPRVFLPAIEVLRPGPVVYAPFSGADRTLGVLSVDNAKGGRLFDALDLEVIGGFARQAGLAIELARSRGDRDRLRMLEDRERIGRNLHDTVIQRLFAVGMLLQATVAGRDDPMTDRISKAIDEIDTTIKEIRTSIFMLSAPPQVGVRAEILDVVNEYADRAGFEPHVVFDGPVDAAITGRVQRHLVATVREAVSNASRHAQAERVEVSLAVGDDVVLRVSDDGIGLPEGEIRHSGLANLRARAEELDGWFDVTSTPGSGTIVTWSVPLGAGREGGATDG